MRKFVFFALFSIGLLILSCEDYYKTKQVINDSDYSVTFTFNDFRETEYTLNPHTSDYYTESPYIKSYSAIPPRVLYKTDYDNKIITFYNTPARQIKIVNNLDRDVLVSANGCMAIEPITVPGKNEAAEPINEVMATIYAVSPEFTGVTKIDNFPVNFTVSTDGKSVIIHWRTQTQSLGLD